MARKFISFLFIFVFLFSMNTTSITAQVKSDVTKLNGIPGDVVANEDNSWLYMSYPEKKEVSAINTKTKKTRSISFNLFPESLYYKDNKLYVCLATGQRSSYWWDEEQRGAFAIVDCDTFEMINYVNLKLDPYDIVVSNDNNIYITGGSGQWTKILGYNQKGNKIATPTDDIYEKSLIEYNPSNNKIYTISQGLSPRNMEVFPLNADGTIERSYSWPYHGDFKSELRFKITPDGSTVLNGIGYRINCSAVKEQDLKTKKDMSFAFYDVDFDLNRNKAYFILDDFTVNSYQYVDGNSDYMDYNYKTILYPQSGCPVLIFAAGDKIILITINEKKEIFMESVQK